MQKNVRFDRNRINLQNFTRFLIDILKFKFIKIFYLQASQFDTKKIF